MWAHVLRRGFQQMHGDAPTIKSIAGGNCFAGKFRGDLHMYENVSTDTHTHNNALSVCGVKSAYSTAECERVAVSDKICFSVALDYVCKNSTQSHK